MNIPEFEVFDALFHIIDPRFPLVPNHGYVPERYIARDYVERTEEYNLKGGAVVSGSFQAFDQDYLVNALGRLGSGFVGVTQLPSTTSDEEIINAVQAHHGDMPEEEEEPEVVAAVPAAPTKRPSYEEFLAAMDVAISFARSSPNDGAEQFLETLLRDQAEGLRHRQPKKQLTLKSFVVPAQVPPAETTPSDLLSL